MVNDRKLGLTKATEKVKISEIGWCAAGFTWLEGFGGGFKEGVPSLGSWN